MKIIYTSVNTGNIIEQLLKITWYLHISNRVSFFEYYLIFKDFIYFTMINKHVQKLFISLIGMDVSAMGSLMWKETRVPTEILHTTTVHHGD